MTYRVLHLLDHSWPILDGYSQRSRSIVDSQLQIGMQPHVLTGPSQQVDDPAAAELQLEGVSYSRTVAQPGIAGHIIRNRWPLLRELAIVRLMKRRIEQLCDAASFDVLHAHSPALCGLAALQASRSRRIPFVYEIRSFWEDSAVVQRKTSHFSLRYRLGRGLETFVARRANAVVGISSAMLKDLEARPVSSPKLFHVPNGVDAARFVPRTRDSALATELGVAGVPTIGYLGTLFPWEGIPWLVRAASELYRSGTKFKLLIVGDGAAASEVRETIQALDAKDYVSFLGRVPHERVERYYSVMDVLVYPRLNVRTSEMVTPLKPLEAMALGKSVLGSGVGGIRELIEPEVTGLLFEPDNIQEFCRQTRRLLQDPVLRCKLGAQARQVVAREKDWKVLARLYEGIYDEAVRNHRARN
jgi:PEP-CTERM/exosortase A-associated glycosyltransferase